MAKDVDDSNWTATPAEVRFNNFVTGHSTPLPTHDFFVSKSLKDALQGNDGAWIDLIGFASNLGFTTGDSHQKNRDLSLARCNAVKSLILKYVPSARFNVIDPEGDADSTGGAKNDDGVWRAVLVRVFGMVSPSPKPSPQPDFICGPEIGEQVATVWAKIRQDFDLQPFTQRINACNAIFLPFQKPDGKLQIPTNPTDQEQWKTLAQQFADIDSWDTLPLFQGFSGWLRKPPIYDPATKGPCATPSSDSLKPPANQAWNYDPKHEDENICSNTVQIGGKCWLNGSVNYGTMGIMLRACNDFATTDLRLRFTPADKIYSLLWAKMLINAYKRYGQNPEGAALPIAWMEATFNGGPKAVPSVDGNRPKCKCSGKCKGDVVPWDYVWDPFHKRPAHVPDWAKGPINSPPAPTP